MALTKPKKQQKPAKKVPERRCIGCMETREKCDLIRVVRSPEGEISIDFTGKKSGRGAYLCKNESCLKKARKSGAVSRALSCEIAPEIYDELEKEIRAYEAEAANE